MLQKHDSAYTLVATIYMRAVQLMMNRPHNAPGHIAGMNRLLSVSRTLTMLGAMCY